MGVVHALLENLILLEGLMIFRRDFLDFETATKEFVLTHLAFTNK